ncbi:Uncharacterised protein [[Clostridium] sordellii]|uniref:hypothetical protein n=1 Tax=Paraclostridium sordellii TaxID=1505 RepID=UPI0005E97D94|nr:hypothetical protein [Paeniclostridium sordellii]CEQ09816.1 Uncharacterised protein [[Clostridium] sordellii] [Paeniclostridium sordellii]
MIFNYIQPKEIYKLIFEWLTSKSIGEHVTKSDFTFYQKKLWNPILNTIEELRNKKDLSDEEKEFLESSIYSGDIFRVLNYKPRDRKYVREMDEYQSWSKSTKGLSNIQGIHGKILLIIGESDIGINIFGLLCFLIKHKYIENEEGFYSFKTIERYSLEEEVAFKTSFSKIEKIVVIDSNDLIDYSKKIIREIPKELWGRKKF